MDAHHRKLCRSYMQVIDAVPQRIPWLVIAVGEPVPQPIAGTKPRDAAGATFGVSGRPVDYATAVIRNSDQS